MCKPKALKGSLGTRGSPHHRHDAPSLRPQPGLSLLVEREREREKFSKIDMINASLAWYRSAGRVKCVSCELKWDSLTSLVTALSLSEFQHWILQQPRVSCLLIQPPPPPPVSRAPFSLTHSLSPGIYYSALGEHTAPLPQRSYLLVLRRKELRKYQHAVPSRNLNLISILVSLLFKTHYSAPDAAAEIEREH